MVCLLYSVCNLLAVLPLPAPCSGLLADTTRWYILYRLMEYLGISSILTLEYSSLSFHWYLAVYNMPVGTLMAWHHHLVTYPDTDCPWFEPLLNQVVLMRWLGSRVVSVLDSGAEGPGFASQSQRCRVTVLGKLFTPIVPLFTKQQNW